MNRLQHKSVNQKARQQRVRSRLYGTAERPRLSVSVSIKHVTAQLIDDSASKTLVFVSSSANKEAKGSLMQKSTWVGTQVGKKAKAKKITKVVFDRGGKPFHGRIKALADAAKAEGMEF